MEKRTKRLQVMTNHRTFQKYSANANGSPMTHKKILPTTQIVSISSETLKSYLPEVKTPKTEENVSNDMALAQDSVEAQEEKAPFSTRKVLKNDESKRIVEDEQSIKRQSSRTVIMEEESNELLYEDALNTHDLNKSASDAKNDSLTRNVKKDEANVAPQDKDEIERVDDASPAHNPISNVIQMKGLTRPFTINQLKELLSKHGKLIEGLFWMNTVKSNCHAAFEDVEGAKAAREALHGIRWPQSNPRTLRVDYGTEEELVKLQKSDEKPAVQAKQENKEHNLKHDNEHKANNHKENKEPAKQATNDRSHKRSNSQLRDRDGGRKRNGKEELAEKERPVREWDLPKLRGSRSRSRDISMERRRKDQDKRLAERNPEKEVEKKNDEPATEEPPAKMLDDLFRKTKATPYIYWLPLTEEQYLEKERQREKRMEERRLREIEREKREQAELANTKQENGKRANSSARNTSTERRNGVVESSEKKNSSDDRSRRDHNDNKNYSSSRQSRQETNERRRRTRSRSVDRRRDSQRR